MEPRGGGFFEEGGDAEDVFVLAGENLRTASGRLVLEQSLLDTLRI